jgi:hypothetical protein
MLGILFRYLVLLPIMIVLVSGAALGVWHVTRDPLVLMVPPDHAPDVHQTQSVVADGRSSAHVTLTAKDLGDIGIVVNLPEPLPAKKLPVVFVLGGLGTGQNNIRYVTNPGANVVIGYDWPIPVPFPQAKDLIKQLPALYHIIISIPGQVATAIAWASHQTWADETHISVLGFSLGALAAPAIENLADHDGHTVNWTILAYGGATLGSVFASNPRMKPAWLRTPLGLLIDVLLHPLDPTVNLPHLPGHFLVLEGRDDALIPGPARDRLRSSVPDPKDVVVFGGDHMGVGADKQELLEQIIRVSRNWLEQNTAINP